MIYTLIKDTQKTNLYDFIKKKDVVYNIPCFQRNYSWDEKQCVDLFNDVLESYKSKNPLYIGNIVYYINKSNKNDYVILDGQQRITTLLLMLAAFRDTLYKEFDNSFFFSDIDTLKLKLKQNYHDADVFERILKKTITKEDLESSKIGIITNYNYFVKKFEVRSDINNEKFLETFKNLEIVEISIDNTSILALQNIFEKINSTGKELDQADLIRNLLLAVEDTNEQNMLYKDYWINIEEILRGLDMEKFTRSYLKLKTYKDVKTDEVYVKFKEYFINNNLKRKKVLNDMLKYSKLYKIINDYKVVVESDYKNHNFQYVDLFYYKRHTNGTKNKDYNNLYIYLKLLNMINTDDFYPLYFLLFGKLFDSNSKELVKILNLLSDFILRFRIVGDYGGGGALIAHLGLLNKRIINGTLSCTYNDVLKHLSNSQSSGAAFPSDQEFEKALGTKINTRYAKAILYKLEMKTPNIDVDLDEIEIEHLMPQTLDNEGWWINNLEPNALETHSTYLNCIGNLALISPDYNKDNSNKPWNIKLDNIKDIQFYYTNEIYKKYKIWKKKSIRDRNAELTKIIVKEFISPLKREKPLNSPYIMKFKDLVPEEFTGEGISSVSYELDFVPCKKWNDLIPSLFKINQDIPVDSIRRLIKDNIVHKSTKCKYDEYDYSPIIAFDKKYFVYPIEINYKTITFYVEGTLSAASAISYAKAILKELKMLDKYKLEKDGNNE